MSSTSSAGGGAEPRGTSVEVVDLNDVKLELVNLVCASLLGEPRFNDERDMRARWILELVAVVAQHDPEFILKVVLYVRDELNIRSTANFLMAVAANTPACAPFLKKYFKKSVRLPSDWLDVAALYQMLPDKQLEGKALPSALRKAMIHKFPDFDSYQLGKYNKENSLKRKRRKAKERAAKLAAEGKPVPPEPERKLTMKQMIRQLHVSKPIPYVMCVLGKKYPSNEAEFRQSGLSGEFEPDRAGSRMKLPVPETWETLVSAKGNKAETWEELIDHRKLPFMAMLRNLRNMLLAGISPKHHRWVMSRLTDERTVANSRQFPFAFFSAYEAINIDLAKLQADVDAERARRKGGKTAKPAAAPTRGSSRGGRGRGRGRGGAAAAAAGETRRPKKVLIPKFMPHAALLDRYREALDTAVKIATVHNVKPIRGTTVVLCSAAQSMRNGISPARNVGSQRTFQDVSILLGLMCKYMCEECDFRLFAASKGGDDVVYPAVQLRDGTILDNMKAALGQATQLGAACAFPYEHLENLIRDRKKIDQLIVIADKQIAPGCEEMQDARSGTTISDILRKYRQEINPDLLFVSINVDAKRFGMRTPADRSQQSDNDVVVSGFSDAILKYIAERGDGNQLQCIQHIDQTKGLDSAMEKFEAAARLRREARQPSRFWSFMDKVQECQHEGCGEKVKKEELRAHMQRCEFRLVACPSEGCGEKVALNLLASHAAQCLYHKLEDAKSGKWRTAKVFVSSTFLDMHGERDVLARKVFPELRERCKSRRVNFFEVDLRWGITAEESRTGASLEGCLDQVDRCRPFFLGMLGDRYGGTYDEYRVSADPRFEWLGEYPRGRSITELEFHYGALMNPAAAHSVFMLRDREFLEDVPPEHAAAFRSEGDAATRLEELRERIRGAPGVSVVDGYAAQWGGLNADGQPVASGLDRFAREVTERLWAAICRVFPQEQGAPLSHWEELGLEHDAFVEARARRFVGRGALLKEMVRFADGNTAGPLYVHGAPGLGKSALMAAFCRRYETTRPGAVVIPHFVGAASGSADIRSTLQRLCWELKRVSGTKEAVPDTYKELKLAFPRFLESASYGKKVVLVIDALNQLSPANRAQSLEWLPSNAPVRIIVSAYTRSDPHTALQYRTPELPSLEVGELPEKERKELVRAILWEYHKKLDEDPANNQMRYLLRKRESFKPLWLTLACQELRMFGVYEDLTDKINSLPMQLDKLCAKVLQRIETENDKALVTRALSLLCCARDGLLESELLALLARPGEAQLPRALWAHLRRAVDCFLVTMGEAAFDSEPAVKVTHELVQDAIRKRYMAHRSSEDQYHAELASHFLAAADPHGDRTWQCDAARPFAELPHHLAAAGQRDELERVLTDLAYLARKCALGQAFDAVAELAAAEERASSGSLFSVTDDEGPSPIASFSAFLASNAHILARHPGLFLQQAANQPDGSAPAAAAAALLGAGGGPMWARWLNKPQTADACKLTLSGYSDAMMACAFSPDGSRMVCASRDRTLRVWDAQSGSELATLSGHTHWVVACAYSPDGNKIVSASWDCSVKVWDAYLGTEIASLNGHKRRASACEFSNDGTCILSGGWDCQLMLWDAAEGKMLKSFKGHTKPVNACAFSPDDSRVVSASWDCTVRVWECESGAALAVLSGHTQSVRSVAFSPNARHVVSTSSDCTVKVWDVGSANVVNTFTGHAQPVNTVAFSADGKHIVSASDDQTIKVWDAHGGSGLQTLRRAQSGSGAPNAVDISPNGKWLASASSDCTLTLWDTFSGMEVKTVPAHTRSLTSVRFSPDGQRVVTAGEDGKVMVWRRDTCECVLEIDAHRGPANTAVFSPDGSLIASGGDDFSVALWEVRDGSELARLDAHTDSVLSVAFNPGEYVVASAGKDTNIIEWDLRDKSVKRTLRGHLDWVTQVEYSPDGKRLASASWDFNVKLWCTRSGREEHVLTGHSGAISGCSWSQDGARLVTSAFDSTLKLWDTSEGVAITTMEGHTQRLNGCVWARSGGLIASCADDCTVRLWDSVAGTEVTTLHGHSDSIRACAFSPAKKQIVSASEDCTVKVWDALAERETSGHSQRVNGVAFSPDSAQLLTASRDATVRVWDAQAVRPVLVFENKDRTSVNGVVMTPNGKRVVAAGDNGAVLVWKNTEEPGEPIVLGGHTKSVRDVAVSAVSNVIASASWDNTVRVWRAEDGAKRTVGTVLSGHGDWVNAVCFAPTADVVASASHDRTVKVWDVAGSTGRCVATLVGHENWVLCCGFSGDGASLVSGSYDASTTLWDVERRCATWTHRAHSKRVNSVCFANGDSVVVSTGDDGSVVVFDTRAREVATRFFCKGAGTSLAVDATSRNVCAADSLGNVHLLQVCQ